MRLFYHRRAVLVLLLSLLSCPVLAADGGVLSADCFSELLPPGEEEDGSAPAPLLDQAELDALVASLLEKYPVHGGSFGLAFQYTGTGETYFVHPDTEFYGASLYKVPLCMFYADLVSRGKMSWEDGPPEMNLEKLVQLSLINSDNKAAGSLLLKTEYLTVPYALNSFSGMNKEQLPKDFRSFYFTPRFMLNTLETLYREPERFPKITDFLKQTQPEHYFHLNLGDRYEIAQKYGQYDGVLHTAGIIFTPTPIILVVMCDRIHSQKEIIGDCAELFSDYALTLDQRAEERRLAAEAEAEAKASAKPAPVPSEAPVTVPSPSPDRKEASSGRFSLWLPVGGCVCMIGFLSARIQKRKQSAGSRK